MDFKDKIKTLRTELGATLEEIGDAVGVSKATVKRWESGEIANIRRDKIYKLAVALRTTPSYLMGWDEEPDPHPQQIEKPAPSGDELLDAELVSRLASLTPEEMQKVDAFVQGLLANR